MSQPHSRTLVFDIETDGLLLECTKMWVAYTYCIETKEYKAYYSDRELVMALNEATTIIGHNILGFDVPALERLTDISVHVPVIDTLILSRLAYYDKDISFSHSLDAHGERLGYPKGKHSDWTQYSEDMDKYCKQDVLVTYEVYKHLLRKTRSWLPEEALRLEQEVEKIITQQYINGWLFDEEKAKRLHIQLLTELDEVERQLSEVFKPIPTFVPKNFSGNKKDGTPTKRQLELDALGCKTYVINGTEQYGLYEDQSFNPGSSKDIVRWIEHLYGKQKWICTEKGTPRVDADSLRTMFANKEWAEPLLKYKDIKKLLGQLAEGDNAWLKKVGKDGRIHGSANILGAVTGRFTHSNPNLAQVPSIRAYKGYESRELFIVPEGYKLVGCDASGLELRTLSHYLALFDGGEYGKKLLEEDIHTANQHAANLPTRDNAKTFILTELLNQRQG